MSKVQDYRERAHECVRMAQAARPHERGILLEMARSWMTLADLAEQEALLLIDGDGHAPSISPTKPQ
jgi:hypothetical protein